MAEQMSRDSFSVDDHGVFHHPLYGSRPAREMIWLTLLDAISNIRDRRANHPEQSVAMDRGLMRGAEAVLDTAQQGGLTVPQWTALIKQDKVGCGGVVCRRSLQLALRTPRSKMGDTAHSSLLS